MGKQYSEGQTWEMFSKVSRKEYFILFYMFCTTVNWTESPGSRSALQALTRQRLRLKVISQQQAESLLSTFLTLQITHRNWAQRTANDFSFYDLYSATRQPAPRPGWDKPTAGRDGVVFGGPFSGLTEESVMLLINSKNLTDVV